MRCEMNNFGVNLCDSIGHRNLWCMNFLACRVVRKIFVVQRRSLLTNVMTIVVVVVATLYSLCMCILISFSHVHLTINRHSYDYF